MKREIRVPKYILLIVSLTFITSCLTVYFYIYFKGTYSYVSGEDPVAAREEYVRQENYMEYEEQQEISLKRASKDFRQYLNNFYDRPIQFRESLNPVDYNQFIRQRNHIYKIHKTFSEVIDSKYENPYSKSNKLETFSYVANETPIIRIIFNSPFGTKTEDIEISNITAGDILNGYFDYSSTKTKYTGMHLKKNDKKYILILWGILILVFALPFYFRIKIS